MGRKYDYTAAAKAARISGLTLIDSWLDQADEIFARNSLSQHAVDDLMTYYCHVVTHIFNPRIYTIRQRISLALHFLFGRKF